MTQGKIRWFVRFVIATMALIIIYAMIQPKIDAEIARQSIELATKQMEIKGTQEYSVYHNITQVCYWALRIVETGAWMYIGFCSYNFICNKGESKKANRELSDSLTPELINKQRMEKWNGVLLQIVSDSTIIKDFVN